MRLTVMAKSYCQTSIRLGYCIVTVTFIPNRLIFLAARLFRIRTHLRSKGLQPSAARLHRPFTLTTFIAGVLISERT